MQEFIDSLELPFEGKMRDKNYVVRVNTSDEFSDLFNAISLNKHLNLLDDSVATVDEAKFVFTDGEYDVKLEADYKTDYYSLTVEVR